MRSMMVAVDIAPPAHMVTSAVDASRRSSSCRAVVSSRDPVLPTGCPSAMAPPSRSIHYRPLTRAPGPATSPRRLCPVVFCGLLGWLKARVGDEPVADRADRAGGA